MAKTLYSLMLSEDVVREIDRAAHRMGTNRSSLINSVLAEYVGLTTPERRIGEILSQMERLLSPAADLVPFLAPNSTSLSLKSSLEYRYRPTVKYEVELYRGNGGSIGEISVIFRTQSAQLLEAMADFFRLWKQTEDEYLRPAGVRVDYALYDGKFTRSIALPQRDLSTEALADVLTAYIRLFDRCMKDYLTGRADASDLKKAYVRYLEREGMFI